MDAQHEWYTIVAMGEADSLHEPLPRGPWQGSDEASAALDRWRERVGIGRADEVFKAHNGRIIGPFCTREQAKTADITDGWERVCRH